MTLAATALTEYRASYAASNLDLHEHRMSRYGAFDAFQADAVNLLPELGTINDARTTSARAVKVPVIKRDEVTLISARSCSVVAKRNESALVTVTYATTGFAFDMYPAEFYNNELGYIDDFKRKMDDGQRAVLEALDTACVAKLETVKSAVNNADGNPYAVVADTMIIPNGDEDTLFNELSQIMAQNDLYGKINVVASPRMKALIQHLINQGVANDENTAYQFMDYMFRYTNRATVPVDARDIFYAYPDASVAFTNWNDMTSRMGAETTDGKKWSIENLPLIGLNFGLLFHSSCADGSTADITGSAASESAVVRESFRFTTDYALISAYNSDTTTYPGVVFKGKVSRT